MKTRKATAAMKAHAATLPRPNPWAFMALDRWRWSPTGRNLAQHWDTFRYQKMPGPDTYRATAKQVLAQVDYGPLEARVAAVTLAQARLNRYMGASDLAIQRMARVSAVLRRMQPSADRLIKGVDNEH